MTSNVTPLTEFQIQNSKQQADVFYNAITNELNSVEDIILSINKKSSFDPNADVRLINGTFFKPEIDVRIYISSLLSLTLQKIVNLYHYMLEYLEMVNMQDRFKNSLDNLQLNYHHLLTKMKTDTLRFNGNNVIIRNAEPSEVDIAAFKPHTYVLVNKENTNLWALFYYGHFRQKKQITVKNVDGLKKAIWELMQKPSVSSKSFEELSYEDTKDIETAIEAYHLREAIRIMPCLPTAKELARLPQYCYVMVRNETRSSLVLYYYADRQQQIVDLNQVVGCGDPEQKKSFFDWTLAEQQQAIVNYHETIVTFNPNKFHECHTQLSSLMTSIKNSLTYIQLPDEQAVRKPIFWRKSNAKSKGEELYNRMQLYTAAVAILRLKTENLHYSFYYPDTVRTQPIRDRDTIEVGPHQRLIKISSGGK